MFLCEPWKSKHAEEARKRIEIERARILTDAEKAQIQCNMLMMREFMPELEDFIKELHDAGMVSGLRALGEVNILDE